MRVEKRLAHEVDRPPSPCITKVRVDKKKKTATVYDKDDGNDGDFVPPETSPVTSNY